MKVIFYVDGQNIHHSLEKIGIDSQAFNFFNFFSSFLKGWKGNLEIQIKYYGAIFPREIDEAKHHCDDRFFDRLEKKQGVVVRKGKFKYDRSGRKSYPPREKGVDVLLAVDLIYDGFHQNYDQAFIVSDDTDLIPAVEKAKKISTGIKIHNLSCNPLHDFKIVCDGTWHIYKNVAKKFREFEKPNSSSLEELQNKFKKK